MYALHKYEIINDNDNINMHHRSQYDNNKRKKFACFIRKEAYRASVAFGNKGSTFEHKKEIGAFGDKKDGVSGKLKEETINKVKKLPNKQTIKNDILELTDKGRRQATQIQQGLASDFCVWYWVFYCTGNSQHIPTNVSIQYEGTIIYLNLKRSIRDQVILSWRANSCTAKKVKLKLLALFNSVSKEQLEMEEKYRTNVYNEKKL
ncbi:hypothetical protein C2G38_2159009 [Gigaspora rosea]|uniref:Uncharacterized protein n=1 Tax=Gigaspora rosea TaxID=44941 RepID=A0A397VZV0_9GLOM|nr:hypothetical protein C2G38_2159009 [Gigaspora rosea]